MILHTLMLLYNYVKVIRTFVLTTQRGCWAGPVRGDHYSHESFAWTIHPTEIPVSLQEANIS